MPTPFDNLPSLAPQPQAPDYGQPYGSPLVPQSANVEDRTSGMARFSDYLQYMIGEISGANDMQDSGLRAADLPPEGQAAPQEISPEDKKVLDELERKAARAEARQLARDTGVALDDEGGRSFTLEAEASPTPQADVIRARIGQAQQYARNVPVLGTLLNAAGYAARATDVPEWVTGERVIDRAEAAGVSPEGAGALAQINMGLVAGVYDPTDQSTFQYARRALEDGLGEPVEVRMGPQTKVLEYRPTSGGADGQWTTVGNETWTGLWKDALSVLPEGLQVAGEVAGAAGGAAAGTLGGLGIASGPGAIAGGAIGAALTSFAGETARLQLAKKKGLIDLSDSDIFWLAGKRAGIAAASEGLGMAAWAAARRLYHGMYGWDEAIEKALGGVESIQAGQKTAGELSQRVEQATGQPFPTTAGQAVGAPEALAARNAAEGLGQSTVGAEARGAELAARKSSFGADLHAIDTQQAAALNALDYATFGVTDQRAGMENARRAGNAVYRAIQGVRQRFVDPMQQKALNARGREELASRSVGGMAPTVQTSIRQMREGLDIAREAAFEPLKKQYEKFARAHNLPPLSLAPFRDAAKGIEEKYGQSILREINVSNNKLVKAAKASGLEPLEKPIVIYGPDGVPASVKTALDKPVEFAEVQRAIMDIREQLRRTDLSEKPVLRQALSQLEEALVEARNKALPSDFARSELLALEGAYAEAIKSFDNGIVRELVQTGADGRQMASRDALELLLRSPENAQEFIHAIGRRVQLPDKGGRVVDYTQAAEGGPEALRAVQDGIRRMVYDNFVGPGGRVDLPGLTRWLKDKQEALRVLFRADVGLDDTLPVGARKLESMLTARDMAAEAIRYEQTTVRRREFLQKTFGDITADASVVARRLVRDAAAGSEAAPGSLNRAWRLVQRHGDERMTADFQAGIAAEVRRRVVDGNDKLSGQKLDQFINSSIGEEVGAVLGKGYMDNVRLLRDAMRVREQVADPSSPTELKRAFRDLPGLRHARRFLHVFFPPMSPKGRALTAVRGIAVERTQRKIAEALANPERLARLAKVIQSNQDPTTQAGRAALTRVGLEFISDYWEAAGKLGITPESVMREAGEDE